MRILYLDLASHDGLLAVVEEQMMASIQIDHRIDDAALVSLVEDVLKKARWSYQDLTHIACVVGPGGFTSLRVAVALANTFSSQLNIPSCGIHLSDVYELRIKNYELGKVTWVHSTKKHEVFIRESGKDARCITIDELKMILKKGMWMGELIPEHRKIVDESGAEELSLRSLEEILPEFLKQQTYRKQILTPWYGRGW